MDLKSQHQKNIELFMEKAGQDLPEEPIIPDEETRVLRAKLIFEEAMETIEALGITVLTKVDENTLQVISEPESDITFVANKEPNLTEIADGCADISVVTIGTLSACGISDQPVLDIVDRHNLAKFGPGGYRRDDGKWIKPKDLLPPDIENVLKNQKKGLDVYQNETDTVVALSAEDAKEILVKQCGYDPSEVDEFEKVDRKKELSIYEEDTKETVTETAEGWIKLIGRGPLGSTEY